MAKIKTLDTAEYGKTRNTGLGSLNFNEEGVAELADENAAKRLCDVSPTLSLVREDSAAKTPLADPIIPAALESKVKQIDPVMKEDPVIEKEAAPKVEQKEDPVLEPVAPETKQAEDIKQEPEVDYTDEEKEALIETLNEKSIDDLRGICKDAEVAEDEYKEFKGAKGKESLINFIIDKKII